MERRAEREAVGGDFFWNRALWGGIAAPNNPRKLHIVISKSKIESSSRRAGIPFIIWDQ